MMKYTEFYFRKIIKHEIFFLYMLLCMIVEEK